MVTFEVQTACVVQALFSDLFDEEEEVDCRSLETDSAGEACAGRRTWGPCCRWQSSLHTALRGGCGSGLPGSLNCPKLEACGGA